MSLPSAAGNIVDIDLKQRKFTCIYTERDAPSPSDGTRPVKKRVVDGEHPSPSVNENSAANTPTNGHQSHSPLAHPSHGSPRHRPAYGHQEPRSAPLAVKSEDHSLKAPDERPSVEAAASQLQQLATAQPIDEPPPLISRGSTVQSGQDEEAVVYSQSRMLQDPTGRLRRSSPRDYYMRLPPPAPSENKEQTQSRPFLKNVSSRVPMHCFHPCCEGRRNDVGLKSISW